MASPTKYYVRGGGGLGDLIREYLGQKPIWGRLAGIKRIEPRAAIKAIVCCHNPQAAEFLKYNPYLSQVEFYPWELDSRPVCEAHANGATRLGSASFTTIPWVQPDIYLDPGEAKQAEAIKAAGKYIFIHPFAGLGDRIGLPPVEYIPLIDAFICKGFNVVAVGASYARVNSGGSDFHEEVLSYQKQGFYNLVGCSSARISAFLAGDAAGFIGTHSCYIHVPWAFQHKTVLMAPAHLEAHLMSGDLNSRVTSRKLSFNKTIYVDRIGFAQAREEAFSFLTKE